MFTSLDRAFSLILRGGAFLALLGVLASAMPEAQAADALNVGSRLKPGGSPAVPKAQADINGPAGSGLFGKSVTVLSNGNFVVTDPNYSAPGPIANVGAVYLYDGATLALISTLTGSKWGDYIGSSGVTVLTNGNYVVDSPSWINGAAFNAGAVTWCNGTTGCTGVVSSANSLVGSTGGDQVGLSISGSKSITALPNGNYVVSSTNWDNGATADVGAVTWCNGTTGCTGAVSSANSLVGNTANDQVGLSISSGSGITALTNGNYVVSSTRWDNSATIDVGAVTWCNGTTGCTGAVTSSNSLVGSTASDYVGGVKALTNGNYVVSSPSWTNGATIGVGAVTWCNGTTGCTGAISSANSLVGSTASDGVGGSGVTALTNGNYVVRSPFWGFTNVGAVTWCNGTTGCTGAVTSVNSLVGSSWNDNVGGVILGGGDVTALPNGNYVVGSPYWDNGSTADVGAVTWCNGTTGCTGVVTSSNSLVGSTANDNVGLGDSKALTNGNYVVSSMYWDYGLAMNVGAVTWCNGTTGCTGAVSSANSLVGSTPYDNVGGVTALTNGNYVVGSPSWTNGATAYVGAVTWCNGTTGCTGAVTSANSLVGSTSNDQIGGWNGVTALMNGNYVVGSPYWDNGATADVGAVTWCNGTTGCTGAVTSANSLVGSTANDNVGSGVTALTNGNYVVFSSAWDNGATANVGAVTWCNGTMGCTGVVTSSNSLVGSTANDNVGGNGITPVAALTNSNYAVISSAWDNGATLNAGAITLGDGNAGTTIGAITGANSVRGTAAGGGGNLVFAFDMVHRQLVVGRPDSNIVSVFDCLFCIAYNTSLYLPLVVR